MREVISMWSNTRMIVLTAICAAAYAAILLPFKGLVIIPGLTEVRPGGAIPVVLSFLFGPAAAWGAAFGNIIGDALGGMLTPVSIFGVIGNFFYGFLPYNLWRAFMGYKNPSRSGAKGWGLLVLIYMTSCMTIGSIIGWGGDLLKFTPFAALGLIITVNNFIAAATIATILLALLYERVRGLGLLYFQVMGQDEEDFSDGRAQETMEGRPMKKRARLGAVLCIVGAAVAFFSGLFISAEALQVGYGAAAFASQVKGSFAVIGGMAPGLLILIIGLLLL